MKKSAILLALFLSFLVVMPTFSVPLVRAAEDSWTSLEPMPTARSGLGVAVVDGKIYAIGGQNGSVLSANEAYDPVTNTWSTKEPMPTPRAYFGISVYQNKIYCIGGNIDVFSHTGVNEVYDPQTDTWETKTGIPDGIGRDSFCTNVVNDKIYLISGLRNAFSPWDNSDETLVYNPSSDSWTTKTKIPNSVHSYASEVIANKIYIMGGRDILSDPHYFDLTQIYDISTDTWSQGKEMPTEVFSAAAGATTGLLAPKRIYVFGGNPGNNIASNVIQVYDPETNTWTVGTPMPTSRWGLQVAVISDELYAIGGKAGEGENYLAVNEKYTPVDYVSEFPSWILLPLLLTVVLVVVVYRKRLIKSPIEASF